VRFFRERLRVDRYGAHLRAHGPPESRLEASPPADKEQERRRLEDLPETVGPPGRFPRTRRNFRNIPRRVFCFCKKLGIIFVPPFECGFG